MTHCHCSMCRKAHAAAFATYLAVRADDFAMIAGAEAVVDHESSPGFHRAFCGRCGSVVPSTKNGDNVYIPAGCLDDDPGIRPTAHIFVASKAPWYTIADDLPKSDTYSDAASGPVIERPAHASDGTGTLRGSCLCGGVAYRVKPPFRVIHNCHCSRCRKARAAAHTTNGFAATDDVEFLRGQDLLRRYKVPEARFFAHTFCSICGSGMPRPDDTRDFVAVPFGSLDDDPGRGAEDHIFIAYKAPWYEIADELPQFGEGPG